MGIWGEGGKEGRGGGGNGEGTCLPITPMHAIEGDFGRGDGVGMWFCCGFEDVQSLRSEDERLFWRLGVMQ